MFAGAVVLGSLAARRIAGHLPADRLRRWFPYLVFATATFVLVQALLDPAGG